MLKNLSRILPFFIITLLSIGGVELFYGVAEHYLLLPATKAPVKGTAVTLPGAKPAQLVKHKNYKVILDRNLFQSYSRQNEAEVVEPVKKDPLVGLETTSLDLVLMGTISGSQNRSRAIIMEKAKKKQDIYYTGDVVQEAQIKEILRAKVILTYQGKDEILDMTEASKFKPRQSAAAAPTPARKKVVSRPKPRKRPVPARIKPRNRPVPQVPEPGLEEEIGSDSDSDAVEMIDGQDPIQEQAENIDEPLPPEEERRGDTDANGREQVDN